MPNTPRTRSTIQTLAWVFCAIFLVIYALNFVPGVIHADGKMFGLFKIDWYDDVGHLLAGLLAGAAAWHSLRATRIYFWVLGVAYTLDVIIDLIRHMDDRTWGNNLAVNTPHIILLLIGFLAANLLSRTEQAK